MSQNIELKHFNVAGTSFRQKELKEICGEEYYAFSYSKSEFIDYYSEYEKVYEYNCLEDCILEEELDNPQDPNAIKVIVKGIHIGYIKAGACSQVKKILKNPENIVSLYIEIKGGKCKYWCEDENNKEKIITKPKIDLFADVYIKINK